MNIKDVKPVSKTCIFFKQYATLVTASNNELFFTIIIMYSQMKLELMFMKHYAPNRCLYIKVAKLRTGVGSAEMSHLQNCSLKIYLKRALGGGGGGGGGGQVGGGGMMDVNEELN